MGKLNRLLPKSRFARAVSVLAGGTAGAQLIVIAASPILTRLYTPEDFGLLAVFTAVLSILSVISSLRYQLAIPLPESDDKAINVAALSFIVLIGLTILLSVFVWGLGNSFLILLNSQGLKPYLWLLPVGLASVGVYQILQYWSLRAKDFGLIAKTKMVQSTSVVGFQLIGASIGPLALLASRAIGQIIVGMMLLRNSCLSISLIKSKINFSTLLSSAKEYKQFPLFSSWAGLLNAAGAQMPPLFFAAVFGPAAAGGYMLAQRVINMPISVIGTAVSDVFLPSSIDAKREDRLRAQVHKLLVALASLILPFGIFIFFIAPDSFQVVFGNNWRFAGEIVRYLSPMLAIQFLVNPISRIFVTIEKQGLALIYQFFLFSIRLFSLIFIYVMDLRLIESVIIFGAFSVVGYLIYLVLIIRQLKISMVSLFRSLLWNFIGVVFLSVLGFFIFIGRHVDVLDSVFFSMATTIAICVNYKVMMRNVSVV